MASNAANAQRWFEHVSKGEHPGSRWSSNVCYGGADALYSFGTHFPLVIPLHDEGSSIPRLWLLNGDHYSNTTAHHQSIVRDCAESTDIPRIIVPFSALRSAGIDRYSIQPIDIKADWYTLHAAKCDGKYSCWEQTLSASGELEHSEVIDRVEGEHTHQRAQHHLGASVFKADCAHNERVDNGYEHVERQGVTFLSAFDEQEMRQLYFLCELPSWAEPNSYAAALQALKPVEVVKAEQLGESVTRQGDIFAICEELLTTRELTQRGAVRDKRTNRPMPHLLGTNHSATEIAVVDEDHTYARGTLYHEPGMHRRRDHVRRKMGDGKAWHRILKNTVPQNRAFAPRAWTQGGRVD